MCCMGGLQARPAQPVNGDWLYLEHVSHVMVSRLLTVDTNTDMLNLSCHLLCLEGLLSDKQVGFCSCDFTLGHVSASNLCPCSWHGCAVSDTFHLPQLRSQLLLVNRSPIASGPVVSADVGICQRDSCKCNIRQKLLNLQPPLTSKLSKLCKRGGSFMESSRQSHAVKSKFVYECFCSNDEIQCKPTHVVCMHTTCDQLQSALHPFLHSYVYTSSLKISRKNCLPTLR